MSSNGDSGNGAGERARELDRSLGFLEASTIGVGTMIGAGIFVFPGIAAGKAGMGATISFSIGLLVALAVALPTAELATAMPESGGGYYFVSRGPGGVSSTVVGLGQWLGLMFATAFYLIGFGHYVVELLSMLGVSGGKPVTLLALVCCVLLTGVNIVGTEGAGHVQNMVVLLLLLILSLFGVYGLFGFTGYGPEMELPNQFVPNGWLPVLTTSALIFTSYLGFAQIATVAGEIKAPARNLPLAMVGSVMFVGGMYVLTVLICNSVFSSEELARMGETALVSVGGAFFGRPGRVLIVFGGLLATVSSANASIMSSSRALYALSRDQIVPEATARVSERFGTPHYSLLVTGTIIAFLLLGGYLELLAEVASLLHLVMYALICFTLLFLRRRDPDWYNPDFQVPLYPYTVVLGGGSCLAVVFFMDVRSLIAGSLLVLAFAFWHYVYRDNARKQRKT